LLALAAMPILAAQLLAPVQVSAAPRAPVPQVQGIDGLLYDPAPLAVAGSAGVLFYGYDFDVACSVGKRLKQSMKQLSRLSKVIARSGRKVVFTAAPAKSAVLTEAIDPSQLPQGYCDQVGVAEQNQVLDQFHDRNYLPIRQALRDARGHQTFWNTDPHWTTAGASIFAKALATRLDPKLGRRQHYDYSHETRVGSLNELRGIQTPETVETATPRHGSRVQTEGATSWSYPTIIFDHSWRSAGKQVWPGDTLLVGDSYMWFALDNLRPIFKKGRFMWYAHVNQQDLLQAMVKADTVVIDVYQSFLPSTYITTDAFRHQVRRTLH
jgi:hypothetical protein